MQFSGQRARNVLRNQNDFFDRWRNLAVTWPQESGYLEEQGAEAEAHIEIAKNIYLRFKARNKHDQDNYSGPWLKFADAVVEQILELDPHFARAPMIAEMSARPKPHAKGESVASG
eukprot:190479-Pyramimonas_sp.AAC.1